MYTPTASQSVVKTSTTLLPYLMAVMPGVSRTRAKAILSGGGVKVDGRIQRQFDLPLTPGQTVEIARHKPRATLNSPFVKIVFEDAHIIVVEKNIGILSMATNHHAFSVKSVLDEYFRRSKQGCTAHVVHRLDRDTSGLMMFAKSMEAKEAMQHNWNNMVISRNYVAVVEGVVEQKSGVIRSWLNETSQYEVYSTQEEGNGQLAITRYNVLDAGHGYSLVEFSLDTGRKNQIRVHAAQELKHPIVGDRKYGAASSPIHRLALHARTLRFAHPITREDMNFELPIPSRFAGLVKYGTNKNK